MPALQSLPLPPDQGLSRDFPELSRQVTSSGVATTLKITQLGARATRPPHCCQSHTGPWAVSGRAARPPARSREAAVEVQHYPMQTVLPSRSFVERHVANSPWRLYMENCLSNSQTLSQLNGCITPYLS